MSDSEQRESPIDAQLAAPPPSYHSGPSAPRFEPPNASRQDLLQNRGAVLALLFLVSGALGIPLLWINRNFSPTERIVWTIIVIIYTLLLVAFTAWIVWWAYSRVF
jgi:hypothetical protein